MSDSKPDQILSARRERGRVPELVARLSRDLALLVRIEVETAAVRHAVGLRRFRRELALLLVGLASVAFAALLISLALLRLLESSMRGWLAAVCLGAGWLLAAMFSFGALARAVRRRRRTAPESDLAIKQAQAEADAAASMEALVGLLLAELTRREAKRVAQLGEQELVTVEHELGAEAEALAADAGELEARAASALEELVEIVTLPGRAGIEAIRRLLP